MNFFLYINRNLIFGLVILIIIFFLIIIFSEKLNQIDFQSSNTERKLPNVDITEPKFAINNNKQKIYISAKEGNFINKDEILLKKNVRFNSNDFSIETEKVIFNRNEQTAQSNTESIFKTKNTTIASDGFNIYDKGNKIVFYGNSIVILK